MPAYYNEFDPYAAQWLRNLIDKGLIAAGDVDERSIKEVTPDDLRGYTQCHFFAGIGGWSLALRFAMWPDDRPVWTGSCPCQPFSSAGNQKGTQDERHLWPVWFDLIRSSKPPVVMGEQVAAAVGKNWLDGVRSDLEAAEYTIGPAVLPACAVDAPRRRDRLWFVADSTGRRDFASLSRADIGPIQGSDEKSDAGAMANADSNGCHQGGEYCPEAGSDGVIGNSRTLGDPSSTRGEAWVSKEDGGRKGEPEISDNRGNRCSRPWGECDWIQGADGKTRRVKPGIRLLAHGVSARVGKLRAFGNAIVPKVAAEVIAAYMEGDADAA